jgi:hypothetical protein
MVVAAIAAVELPQLQWTDLIEVLLGFVNNPEQVNLRISTLQAIGFICEQIVSKKYETSRSPSLRTSSPETRYS